MTNIDITIWNSREIVFYDGDCVLCNRWVVFLLRHHTKELYFVSLQSTIGVSFLQDKHIHVQPMNTLYFYTNGIIYSHSTAVLKIFAQLNPFTSICSSILLWIPKNWRDKIYSFVAKRRYLLIKNKSHCITLSASQKQWVYLNE